MNRREFIGCGLASTAVAVCPAAKLAAGEARIIFLGTSHGAVRPPRFCSCTMLQYGGKNYLVDAADGAAGRVRWTGLQFWDLEALFVTHPHSDHIGGIPQLLRQYDFAYTAYASEAPRNFGKFRVYLPGDDVRDRHLTLLNHPYACGGTALDLPKMLYAYKPGVIFDDGNVRVSAFGNNHMGRRPDGSQIANSFLFELSNGKRIYFSGDLSDEYDLPLEPFKDGKKIDLLVSELVHYPLECAVKRLKGRPVGKICFQHYWDAWEAGQPGRDERFAKFQRDLAISAEIVTDLDIRII